jgi:PAS domain S-box-containing protein
LSALSGNENWAGTASVEEEVETRFSDSIRRLHERVDRFFARLLIVQWLASVVVALAISPTAWEGRSAQPHFHVWAAILLGGAISVYPAWLGWTQSGKQLTRHVLGISQMLMSALLIHLTGGRIETHFHVFGSLAFLAFYRDLPVLLSATVVVYVDHLLRGFLWPESVYGVFVATPWRSVEHAFWVLFEVAFLSLSIRKSLEDMREVAQRQASLENLNGEMEYLVRERTCKLAESEVRFRALFQNAPVGLYRAAGDGTLVMANPTMLAILGFDSAEEMCANGVKIQGGDAEPLRGEFYAELLLKNELHGWDLTWRRKNGAVVHVCENAKAFRDAEDRIVHFEGSVEDVSERRQLEERYLQSQKVQAIGQLAGGVAHDFNNILTAILGYSDLVLDTEHIDPGTRKQVSEIKSASERAASLTQQLLAFSRKQTLQPRVIQLNTVVSEMDSMIRRLVGEDIAIRTLPAADLTHVRADHGQIQQVLLNLVVNARDAMPGGGSLTIETCNVCLDPEYVRLHPDAMLGSHAMLAVSDNGTGMSSEVKARIFEPFFTTKDPGTGTGLGLATCHGIVKQSGGHITVYSEAGLGTTFKVYLPSTTDLPDASRAASNPRSVRGGTETVLLVEDEPMVRELGILALSSLGYRVYEAANGLEAIRQLQKIDGEFIHLLVTDVVMPEMGGRELARHLRRLSPSTRVLFSSGYTYDAIERTDLLEEGIFFLQKPYTMSILGEKVREVLEGAKSSDAPVPVG